MNEKYLNFSVGQMAYYVIGTGKPVVILHGWGQNFLSFEKIIKALADEYQIIGVDFLGFGLSDEPSDPLEIEDYTLHLKTLFEVLKIKNPTIMAHSFGGRIAIHYAKDHQVDKLLLVSSAGIRFRSIKRTFKIYKYKILKRLYKIFSKERYDKLINSSGSRDYKNASDVMKRTLSNVIKYSAKNDLKKINAKTYLLWGINDTETKYSDALIMNKLIKDSKLIPFYNSGHFCYLEEESKFIREVNKILKEDSNS